MRAPDRRLTEVPHALRPAVLVALLSITACNAPAVCEVLSSVDLADDEPTPEGMTANDVLVIADSPHVRPFAWRAGRSNATSDESTTITVTTTRLPESARHEVTEQTGTTEQDLNCGSHLLVPVRVHLETSDGALDDAFEVDLDADLRGGIPTTLSFFLEFAFEDLSGWLEPTATNGVGELSVRLGTSELGDVSVRTEERSGGDVTEQTRSLGQWGAVD